MRKRLTTTEALEFASPSTTVPCFSTLERAQLGEELSRLGSGYPLGGYGIEPADWDGARTLESLDALLADPNLTFITDNCGEDRRRQRIGIDTATRRFIRAGVHHYSKRLPKLKIDRARIQIIADSQMNPYNPGGMTAHTDAVPIWDKGSSRRKFELQRYCFAVSSIDPGTFVCRLTQPLRHGHTAVEKLMRTQVRQNKGPKPENFMRAVRRSRGVAVVTENRGGDATAFNGESVHWRSNEGRQCQTGLRYFAVLDLYIARDRHNTAILQAAATRTLGRRREKVKITPRPHG